MSSDTPIPVEADVVEVVKAGERSRVAQFLREIAATGKPMDFDQVITAIESGDLMVPEAAPVLFANIGELLRASWLAHTRAKQMRAARVAPGQRRPLIEEAYRLRQQAHELDPEHRDVAWAAEASQTAAGVNTHEAVLAFYRQQLGVA